MEEKIKITSFAIKKDEQLDIARLLKKAGYTVSITKDETVNRKSTSFINYGKQEG